MQKLLESIRLHEEAIRELKELDKQKKLTQRGRALLEFHQTESARCKEVVMPFIDYLQTETDHNVCGHLETAICNYYFEAAEDWDTATVKISQYGFPDSISKKIRRACSTYDRS